MQRISKCFICQQKFERAEGCRKEFLKILEYATPFITWKQMICKFLLNEKLYSVLVSPAFFLIPLISPTPCAREYTLVSTTH